MKSCPDFLLFLNKAELPEIEELDFAALNLNLNNIKQNDREKRKGRISRTGKKKGRSNR